MSTPYNITLNVQAQADPASLQRAAGDVRGALRGISAPVNIATSGAQAGLARIASGAQAGAAAVRQLQEQSRTLSATLTGTVELTNSGAASLSNFAEQAGLAARRFTAFSLAAGAIVGVVRGVQEATRAAIDFELSMNKVEQVASHTRGEMAAIRQEIGALSTSLGVSSAALAEVRVTLEQAGLNAKQTSDAMRALALTDLAPTFDNMKRSTEGLIAAFRQFNLDSKQFESTLSSINAVAAQYAVESSDIVTAIQKAGGAFRSVAGDAKTGGEALNEFVGLFTSVRATTRESAESIATGLRTVFSRLQKQDTVQALEDLGINLRYTREEAAALGRTDLEKQFVGAYEAVKRLSTGLKGLRETDPRYAQVLDQLGGQRQISRVLPLLKEFKTAQEAVNIAQAGQISLQIAAEKRQESLANKTAKLKEEYLDLFRKIVGSDSFQSMANSLLNVASGFAKILDFARPLLPLLTAFGAIKLGLGVGNVIASFSRALVAAPGASVANKPGTGVVKFATGGPVGVVPGVGDSDTVPAQLPSGSFVIKKRSARQIGYAKLHAAACYAGGGETGPKVDALLTPGEFVFDPRSAQRIGYGKLKEWNERPQKQKYADGGLVRRVAVRGLVETIGDRDPYQVTKDIYPDPIPLDREGIFSRQERERQEVAAYKKREALVPQLKAANTRFVDRRARRVASLYLRPFGLSPADLGVKSVGAGDSSRLLDADDGGFDITIAQHRATRGSVDLETGHELGHALHYSVVGARSSSDARGRGLDSPLGRDFSRSYKSYIKAKAATVGKGSALALDLAYRVQPHEVAAELFGSALSGKLIRPGLGNDSDDAVASLAGGERLLANAREFLAGHAEKLRRRRFATGGLAVSASQGISGVHFLSSGGPAEQGPGQAETGEYLPSAAKARPAIFADQTDGAGPRRALGPRANDALVQALGILADKSTREGKFKKYATGGLAVTAAQNVSGIHFLASGGAVDARRRAVVNSGNVQAILKEFQDKTNISHEDLVSSVDLVDYIKSSNSPGESAKAQFQTKSRQLLVDYTKFNSVDKLRRVLFHELGHALDFKIGGGRLSTREAGSVPGLVGANYGRRQVQERGLAGTEYEKYVGSPQEGFAEAVSETLAGISGHGSSLLSSFERGQFKTRIFDKAQAQINYGFIDPTYRAKQLAAPKRGFFGRLRDRIGFAEGGQVLRLPGVVPFDLSPRPGRAIVSVSQDVLSNGITHLRSGLLSYGLPLLSGEVRDAIDAGHPQAPVELSYDRGKQVRVESGHALLGEAFTFRRVGRKLPYLAASVPERQVGRFVSAFRGNVLSAPPAGFVRPRFLPPDVVPDLTADLLYSEAGRTLLSELPGGLSYLASGSFSHVFAHGPDRVVRVTRRDLGDKYVGRRPDIPGILPALSSKRYGPLVSEVLPRVTPAEKSRLSYDQLLPHIAALESSLDKHGFIHYDLSQRNFGFDSDGKPAIYDTGFLDKKKKFAFSGGGCVPGMYAAGGSVGGWGNNDTEPALLMPGEFVLNKRAVARLGVPNLRDLNTGSARVRVKRYAEGSTEPVGGSLEDLKASLGSAIKSLAGASPKKKEELKRTIDSLNASIASFGVAAPPPPPPPPKPTPAPPKTTGLPAPSPAGSATTSGKSRLERLREAEANKTAVTVKAPVATDRPRPSAKAEEVFEREQAAQAEAKKQAELAEEAREQAEREAETSAAIADAKAPVSAAKKSTGSASAGSYLNNIPSERLPLFFEHLERVDAAIPENLKDALGNTAAERLAKQFNEGKFDDLSESRRNQLLRNLGTGVVVGHRKGLKDGGDSAAIDSVSGTGRDRPHGKYDPYLLGDHGDTDPIAFQTARNRYLEPFGGNFPKSKKKGYKDLQSLAATLGLDPGEYHGVKGTDLQAKVYLALNRRAQEEVRGGPAPTGDTPPPVPTAPGDAPPKSGPSSAHTPSGGGAVPPRGGGGGGPVGGPPGDEGDGEPARRGRGRLGDRIRKPKDAGFTRETEAQRAAREAAYALAHRDEDLTQRDILARDAVERQYPAGAAARARYRANSQVRDDVLVAQDERSGIKVSAGVGTPSGPPRPGSSVDAEISSRGAGTFSSRANLTPRQLARLEEARRVKSERDIQARELDRRSRPSDEIDRLQELRQRLAAPYADRASVILDASKAELSGNLRQTQFARLVLGAVKQYGPGLEEQLNLASPSLLPYVRQASTTARLELVGRSRAIEETPEQREARVLGSLAQQRREAEQRPRERAIVDERLAGEKKIRDLVARGERRPRVLASLAQQKQREEARDAAVDARTLVPFASRTAPETFWVGAPVFQIGGRPARETDEDAAYGHYDVETRTADLVNRRVALAGGDANHRRLQRIARGAADGTVAKGQRARSGLDESYVAYQKALAEYQKRATKESTGEFYSRRDDFDRNLGESGLSREQYLTEAGAIASGRGIETVVDGQVRREDPFARRRERNRKAQREIGSGFDLLAYKQKLTEDLRAGRASKQQLRDAQGVLSPAQFAQVAGVAKSVGFDINTYALARGVAGVDERVRNKVGIRTGSGGGYRVEAIDSSGANVVDHYNVSSEKEALDRASAAGYYTTKIESVGKRRAEQTPAPTRSDYLGRYAVNPDGSHTLVGNADGTKGVVLQRAEREADRRIADRGGERALSDRTKALIRAQAATEESTRVEREFLSAQQRLLAVARPELKSSERLAQAKDDLARALSGEAKVAIGSRGQVLGLQDSVEQLAARNATAVAPGAGFGYRAREAVRGAGRRLGRVRDYLTDNRVTRFTSGINDKYGGGGGTGLFLLGGAASLVADQVDKHAGIAEDQVRVTGGESRYSTNKGISGALQGATIGAGAGFAIYGPVGAAVGAVAGAIYGTVTALQDAEKDIRQAKIGNALGELSDKLSVFATGISDGRTQGGITSQLDTVEEQSRQLANTQAHHLFTGFDDKEYADVLALNRRKNIGPLLPQITQGLSSQAELLGRKGAVDGVDQTPEEVLKALKDQGGGLNTRLIDEVAKVTKQSTSEVEQGLLKTIVSAQNDGRIEKTRLTAARGDEQQLSAYIRFAQATAAAADALTGLQQRADTLSDLLDGTSRGGRVTANVDNLNQGFGRQDRGALKPIQLVANAFGDQSLVKSAAAVDDVRRVLPDALNNLAESRSVEGEDVVTKLSNSIYKQLGHDDPTKAPLEVQRVVNSVRAELGKELDDKKGIDAKGVIREHVGTDSSKFSDRLVSRASEPFGELGRAARDLEANANKLIESLGGIAARTQQIGQLYDQQAEIEVANYRQELQFIAERQGRPSQALVGVPLVNLQSDFNFRQRRLATNNNAVAVPEGSEFSADYLGGRLANNRERIGEQEKLQEKFEKTGGRESKDFIESASALLRLKDESNNLLGALKNLANASGRNAALQEKLANYEKERQSRLGYAERVATADPKERFELQRGLILAKQASEQKNDDGTFGNLNGYTPEQKRSVLNYLSAAGANTTLTGFQGAPTAGDLREKLLSSGDLKDFGLTGGQKDDKKKTEDAITANNKEAASAVGVLAGHLEKGNDQLRDILAKQQNEFFDKLARFHADDKLAGIASQEGSLKTDRGKLNDKVGLAEVLKGVGIDSDTKVDVLTGGKKGDLAALRTAVLNDEARRKKFDDLKAQVGDYRTKDRFLPEFLDNHGIGQNSDEGKRIQEDYKNIHDEAGYKERFAAATTKEQKEDFRREVLSEALRREQNRTPAAIGAATAKLGGIDGLNVPKLINTFRDPKAGALFDKAIDTFGGPTKLESLPDAIKAIDKQLEDLKKKRDEIVGALPPAVAKADGGSIFKPVGSDTVPAMLSPGEFIVNAKSARANAGILKKMNAGVRYAADGGPADPFDPFFDNLGGTPLAVRKQAERERFEEVRKAVSDRAEYRVREPIQEGAIAARLRERGATAVEPGYADKLTPLQEAFRRAAAEHEAKQKQPDRGGVEIVPARPIKQRVGAQIPKKREEEIGAFEASARINPAGYAAQQLVEQQAAQAELDRQKREKDRRPDASVPLAEFRKYKAIGKQLGIKDIDDVKRALVRKAGENAAGSLVFNAEADNINALSQLNLRAHRPGDEGQKSIEARDLATQNAGFDDRFERDATLQRFVAGQVRGFATGGLVPGSGTGDTVPAMLTPGEFVLRKSAVDSIGAGSIQKFAEGGVVAPGGGGSEPGAGVAIPADAVRSMTDLSASLLKFIAGAGGFVQAVQQMTSTFTAFSGAAQNLTEALNNMPRTMAITGQHQVNVVINGAEVLSRLSPEIQQMVSQSVKEQLGRVFKDKMPDAGVSLD